MTPAVTALFDAMGDPTRRAIVARLARGPTSISSLAKPLGISLTAVGQHVRVLERAGLLRSIKQGRTRHCLFEPTALHALEDWAQSCRKQWESRLDRLGELLDCLPDE